MSYDPTQLSTNPVYRLRLTLQDNDMDEYLVDEEYQYILDKNNGDEDIASLEVARTILSRLAQFERSREGQIEIYADSFNRYKEFINDFLEKAAASMTSVILVGGVRQSEVNRVREDPESRPAEYSESYLFDQTERTFGGGSIAAGTEFNNRDDDNTFRLRRR